MSYYEKYIKYKKKYLALKGGAEKKQAECKIGKIDKKKCNDPNFPCLDNDDRCLNRNGDTLQYLKRQEKTVEDKTVVNNTSNYSLDSRGSKNFPKFLKNKVFEFSSCEDIRKYLSLNKSLINEMDEDGWKSLISMIKVDGFDYKKVKGNLNSLSKKNPKYFKKVEQDLLMNFCDYGEKKFTKEYCLIYYFKCIYKKLIDKYGDVNDDTWHESIKQNNVDDYNFFDYFIDTTRIREYVFSDNINLRSVTIPESVIEIGNFAFDGCTWLTSVAFPEGLTIIGEGAFQECLLISVTFPEGLTTIGDVAFRKCNGLTSVTLPEGLTTIKNGAFSECTWLTSVTFPEGLTSIGGFYGCRRLTSLTFPKSLTSIEGKAFMKCTGLTSLTFPEGLTSIGGSAFSGCSGLTSVTFPEGLTSIGRGAFKDCTGLTSVTFPEGLTSIGANAFSGCSGLTSLTFPEGLTSIRQGAFSWCTWLTSVTFPEGLTSIGGDAFSGCSELTSVSFPDGLTSIGDWAFRGCSGLTSVTFPEGLTSIGDLAFDRCTRLIQINIPRSRSIYKIVLDAKASGSIPNGVIINFIK